MARDIKEKNMNNFWNYLIRLFFTMAFTVIILSCSINVFDKLYCTIIGYIVGFYQYRKITKLMEEYKKES